MLADKKHQEAGIRWQVPLCSRIGDNTSNNSHTQNEGYTKAYSKRSYDITEIIFFSLFEITESKIY